MVRAAALFVCGTIALACGSSVGASPPATPPCDQACKDSIALRAFRETLKEAYNLTLQGGPVGPQDKSSPCPLGGKVHVYGTATSNAKVGATEVMLTYVLDACALLQKDTDALQTYKMTLTGTATESGTLAVQPSSTTAISIQSDSMTFSGTVNDPPLDYSATACPLRVTQNGNQVSAVMCGRVAGVTL